jgi:Putative beta barrel porin-7 (BBP7)
MIKLARHLLRVCPIETSTVGKTMMPAILIGILLCACPVLAQIGNGNPPLPPWQRPPSQKVINRSSQSPYRVSRYTATKIERGKATTINYQASASQRSSTKPVSRIEKAGFQATKDSVVQSPVRRLSRPDCSEEIPEIIPLEDGCGDECFFAEGYLDQCGPCNPCYPSLHNRLWVRAEYLLWWTQGSSLPPLVTTSPESTDPSESGVLGLSGTSILFGNETVNTDTNSGCRIALGSWLDACESVGIEAGYLGLGQKTNSFSASSSDIPIIARPFFDNQFEAQSAMLAAHPDFLNGSVSCKVTSRLQAVEVLLRRNLFQGYCNRMDFLLGWRFARLDESLRIDQFSQWTESQGPIVVGTTKNLYDLFDTQNQFNGVELGFVCQKNVGRWSLEATMKLGLGCTHSRVLIDGMTTTTVPDGGTSSFAGDLLAQETNIGQYTQNEFSVLPELGVTLGYDLTCRLRATFGYTFLYWSQVARPADQLDTNLSQLPPETPTGTHQPAFSFAMSDYWAQGLNFGLEYRF